MVCGKEIDGEGKIISVSLPFVIGITAGTLCPPTVYPLSSILPGIALTLSSTCLVLAGNGRMPLFHIPVLFFFLGCFCAFSGRNSIPPPTGGFISATASKGLVFLHDFISSIDFREDRCAPLVCALLTGDKSALTAQETAAFRNSGASHILALSGLHLGVIYKVTGKCFSIAGNSRTARISSSLAIAAAGLFYVIMTGASASILRAYIFILLNEAGRIAAHRKKTGKNTLMAALTIHLAINPEAVSSAAFQLSYLAISGLILISPYISSWYPGKGLFKKIWDITAASISCQLFTAPVALIRFGTFPKYFMLTNLIAMPLSETIIILAVIITATEALGLHLPFLKDACSLATEALLRSMDIISRM